jgi:hypothetical protein
MLPLGILAVLVAPLLLTEPTNPWCHMANAEETAIGPNSGVISDCSNNGFRVECNWSPASGITCVGPHGSYYGTELPSLTASARGCG